METRRAHAPETTATPRVARRTALVAGFAAALIGAGFVALRAKALPPPVVWTLRAADSAGHASLTVHDAPGGAALRGRWLLVEAGGLPPGVPEPGGPRVVLMRLPLAESDGADAPSRVAAGGEVVYRPSGGPRQAADAPGALWYPWSRDGR